MKKQAVHIPIEAVAHIAVSYGYDQVIVIARKIGVEGREAVATYGVDKANCDVAAKIGDFLKLKVMGWGSEDRRECGLDQEVRQHD